MACRFPGAPTVETFWQNLREGRDAVTFFRDEELLGAGATPELLRDPRYVKAGQILPDVDLFDADLFRITSDEADMLDPQQRLFLECAVEAFESAGYDPESFPGSIGVYAGVGMNTYLLCNLGERYRTASSVDRYRLMLGNDKDFLATRVSYKLNLRGPSVNVNTACSTSLVAVHIACLSLMSGDCDMALVGCAHVKVPQLEGYLFQEGLIFSPDGRCRAFDARARGTILGSGVGIVVLKRLSDALAARDWIHAVIKGSSINNDGGAKASYTAPSIDGQAAAISEAQMLGGCEPETISYVEAHGTGTPLGDPIELAALGRVFERANGRASGCAIGSVKTNVGHLDVAAGMAGLIKTCLMLEHQWLVPSLHFETLNPEIDLTGTPFYVNTASKAWECDGMPRRAGVSSFGIGGTNAHVVLEEAPARAAQPSEQTVRLLVVSARSKKALEKASDDLARCLKQHRELDLGDVAYTLAARKAYSYRLALASGDHRDAALTLTLGDPERVLTGCADDEAVEVAFLFEDRVDNAGVADLYRALPAFRRILDGLGVDVNDATPGFLAQYALAQLWMSWNVRPSALVAVGSGALAAGCVAGCFRPATALAIHRIRIGSERHCGFPVAPPELPLSLAGRWLSEREAVDPATWTAPQPATGAARPAPLVTAQGTLTLPMELDLEGVLRNLGRLWTTGAEIDWSAFYADERRGRVPLPPRPFDRKRFWIDPERAPAAPRSRAGGLRHLLGTGDEPARVRATIDFIQREIARILGTSELPDADTNLFTLGIDSLILIEVAAKLTEEAERPVAPSLFVDYFTIRAFAANLVSTISGRAAAAEPPAARVAS